MTWRKTSQQLLPIQLSVKQNDGYTIYPFFKLDNGLIYNGYSTLASFIKNFKNVIIDGYHGVFWDDQIAAITKELSNSGLSVKWHYTGEYFLPEKEIEKKVLPFLNGDDDLWGTKCTLDLEDFFRIAELKETDSDPDFDINIVIGPCASVVNWDAPIIYFEIPKNEIQYRSRANAINNLGTNTQKTYQNTYKRMYFVDWVVLNKHKQRICSDIKIIVDCQWKNTINWATTEVLYGGLKRMSESVFRVRPWFEAGAWGGQWMKDNLKGLVEDEINYAWSFELILPENGLLFESSGSILEISFDFLMNLFYRNVLGKDAERFGTEFPIRFDFLDTIKGGNLSIQCHPSLPYIQSKFGENITQDETYYILDCEDDAGVYLGFQQDIDVPVFEEVLLQSLEKQTPVNIEKYVQYHDAKKHDLFLIPNGTVHSAGTGNLVLEISATPYIFTFKMYDWLRPDLNGNPRPLNISHAFSNLNFDRKGAVVQQELISKPICIDNGMDWQIIHLPTHAEHFYDVHRLEFKTSIIIDTDEKCHVLMLVEGTSVILTSMDGVNTIFQYAETFVIPANAGRYKLINGGDQLIKIIKAFIK